MADVKKVVLAYSGGLDTSVILKWLQDTYNCEVVTFTADLGQGEEVEPARAKAKALGVKEIYIEDLREEFVRDFVFPMFRANTIYEGEYLLGTSIARPLIAKRLIEIANETGADAISHGATGKGNDQVRFELGAYALKPGVKVIAPWREWDLLSREKLMDYAETHGIPIERHGKKKSPYSMDANLLHISYEGGVLEDTWTEHEEDMWKWTVSPEKAPDAPTYIELTYRKGDIVAIDGKEMTPAQVLTELNRIGGANGIGRLDIVENRYVGMKSRGCYETPGGTIMLKAHRAIESITLDREVAHLKDELMPRYAKLIYTGYWWSPEREMLQQMIDASQEYVNGVVRLKLYKGNVIVTGRKSDDSLFDANIATFEEDGGAYNQQDAAGFIKLNALRMRIAAGKGRKLVDHHLHRAGKRNAAGMEQRAGDEADHQRVAHEAPADSEEQGRKALRLARVLLALGPLHQHRTGDHHDRQVHGDEDGERHHAVVADDARDERQADEDGVGEGRRHPGKHADAPVAPETERRREMGYGPGEGDAGEIGDPDAQRRFTGEIRLRDGAEEQYGHGDAEDELAEPLAQLLPQVTGAHEQPADENQREDGKNVEGDVGHGPFRAGSRRRRAPSQDGFNR